MKRPDGVVVIAVYYALLALLFLVGSCAVLIGLVAVLSFANDPTGTTVAAIAVGLSLLLCLLFFASSGLAAWGLLNLKNWARWLAIVLAVLQLWAFPIWTIIGGLIIYYLLRDDVRAAFDGRPQVEPRAQPPVAPVVERSIRQTVTETPAQSTAAPIVEPTTWETVAETPAQPPAAPIVEPITWESVVETPAQPAADLLPTEPPTDSETQPPVEQS